MRRNPFEASEIGKDSVARFFAPNGEALKGEPESKLANATAVERYGRAMEAKGLHARARRAFEEARRLRRVVEAAAGPVLPRRA